MKQFAISIFFILLSFFSNSQNKTDSLWKVMEAEDKGVFTTKTFVFKNKKANFIPASSKVYESQGLYHSTYLILNKDSTYLYYSVFEVGFDLTIGKWKIKGSDTIILNWDRQKTLNCLKDKKCYEKYSISPFPNATPMNNWLIVMTDKILKPIN
jgi:hypothetical protein